MVRIIFTSEFTRQDYIAMEEDMETRISTQAPQCTQLGGVACLELDPMHLQNASPVELEPLPFAYGPSPLVGRLAEDFVSMFGKSDSHEPTQLSQPLHENCRICNTEGLFKLHTRRLCALSAMRRPTFDETFIKDVRKARDEKKKQSTSNAKISPVDELSQTKPGPRRKCGVCRRVGCKGLGGRMHCPIVKRVALATFATLVFCETPKKKRQPRQPRQCQVCLQYGAVGLNCQKGSGNREMCKYYHLNGKKK